MKIIVTIQMGNGELDAVCSGIFFSSTDAVLFKENGTIEVYLLGRIKKVRLK